LVYLICFVVSSVRYPGSRRDIEDDIKELEGS